MRIFLVCQDERCKYAAMMLIENQPGMVVSGISDRLKTLVKQLDAAEPDVLILEWKLKESALRDLMAKIQKLDRQPKVILLSNREDEKDEALKAGVNYFVVTNTPPDELIAILKNIQISEVNQPIIK